MTVAQRMFIFIQIYFTVRMPSYPFLNHFLFLFHFLFWQDRLDGLEAEKGELGQQIDHLLLENRRLLQLKMSLGVEVATYRYAALSGNVISRAPLINKFVTKCRQPRIEMKA